MGQRQSKRKKRAANKTEDGLLQETQFDGSDLPADSKPTRSSSVADWCIWIRNRLHKQHRNLVTQGFPWMGNASITLDDYNIKLNIIRPCEYGEVEEEISDVNKIFESVSETGNQPVRILVEGAPGHGKTTLASKFCFDHANQRNYIKDYDFVLYYPGRLFQGHVEEIFERGAEIKVPKDAESLLAVINNNSRKVLVVFDGLDEVPKELLKSLLPFLRGEMFPHLTVVVTSKPGEFTSKFMKVSSDRSNDEFMNWKDVWKNRIKITGISTKMQQEFVLKHLVNFPEATKSEVIQQLEQLKTTKLILPEYLQCPLFLLMIISVLTDQESRNLQTLRTRTELYKVVLHFIFSQYFRKISDPTVSKINLFSFDQVHKPFYVDLLSQFGQFALEALKTDKVSFSQEEILGSVNKKDEKILQLGLLKRNNLPVSVDGIHNEIFYEPVHKSLMEFAAAYALWIGFSGKARDQWVREVQCLASNRRFGSSSLLLPFLAGLLGDSAGELFQALKPFAPDYLTNWKGWLRACVPELLLTETVLDSLTLFLPTEWTKKWEEVILTRNPRRMTILRHAVKVGRIKWITWRVGDSIAFPSDVAVKKATLQATSRSAKNGIIFRCEHLVCVFSDCIFLPEFKTVVSVLPSIDFQHISFTLCKRLDRVPFSIIRTAMARGKLKDAHIYVIKCNLENEFHHLKTLTDLIKVDRVDVLNACITLDSFHDSSLNVSCINPSSVDQDQINIFIKCAADSSHLTSLILENESQTSFSIDLSLLCNEGKKAWECLVLKGFEIRCQQKINRYFKVKHFYINDDDVNYPVYKFLRSCEVTSLCCSISSLSENGRLSFSHAFLKELNLILDESILHLGMSQLPMSLQNLQVLVLTMKCFQRKSRPFPDLNSFVASCNLLHLKGIEIWHIKRNRELALNLAKGVLQSLAERSTSASCSAVTQPNKLQLHYFLLHDGRGYFDFSVEFLNQLKFTLITKSLSRLDLVDEMSSFSNVRNLFKSEEHFTVEEDLWGSRKDDSIQSRVECDLVETRKLQKRCTILFNP